MSNITTTGPSFVFGYWRPWKENSNVFDSYLDYSKDLGLANYTASAVGTFIREAASQQVDAINNLGYEIGYGMDVLSGQLGDVSGQLRFLNRNMDIQIEQQKLSNLLLQNIAELLRVPDSEKERQLCIEMGVKFLVNAAKDPDLYDDALEELHKAEELRKQDYFVLHRLGTIYLYAEKHMNPEKALGYFLLAAKYASVESDPKAMRLANVMTQSFDTVNSSDSTESIQHLAADSYEKAAFACYVLGRFEEAEKNQQKALKLHSTPENKFLLAKYAVRSGNIDDGVKNLSKAIDESPELMGGVFKELDLVNDKSVLKLISNKNQEIDNEINKLRDKLEKVESTSAPDVIKELAELSKKSYETKVSEFEAYEKKANRINKAIGDKDSEIGAYITEIKKATFCTLSLDEIEQKIDALLKAKDLPFEKKVEVFNNIKKEVDADRLKIGSKYAGGIVFYIDKSGKHGLVCAEKDFGEAIWGIWPGQIGADEDGISNGYGMRNTKKIVEHASWELAWFKKGPPVQTAARLCLESNHNGFTDWYLPTEKEMELMGVNLEFHGGSYWSRGSYWSSTESRNSENRPWGDKSHLYAYGFNLCLTSSEYPRQSTYKNKSETLYVRAVRAF